jgi:hypothetical protein
MRMEFLIFTVISIIAFLLLIFNQKLPLGLANVTIAGFMFMVVGLFMLLEGLTVGTVIVKDTFTNAISIIYILFGIGNAIVSSIDMLHRK